MSCTLYATEIASLLGKDPFKKRDDTLHQIFMRYQQPMNLSEPFQSITLACEDEDVCIRVVQTSTVQTTTVQSTGASYGNTSKEECKMVPSQNNYRLFTRDLSKHICISGKCTLDRNIITVVKNRKTKLHYGPYHHEFIQMQVYLWLTSSQFVRVKFVERFQDQECITFIYLEDETNEMFQSIRQNVEEYFLVRLVNIT